MRTPFALLAATCAALGATTILSAAQPAVPSLQPDKDYGILEETPNQRRIRLGEEIKASYPPPDYGEAVETPNHRRQRLGQPIVAEYVDPDPGVAEETPNHRRARLGVSAGQ